MAFEIQCRPCKGRGYYGRDTRDTCGVCHGRRRIQMPGTWAEHAHCGPCSGNGFHGFDPKETCKVCGGYGITAVSEANGS